MMTFADLVLAIGVLGAVGFVVDLAIEGVVMHRPPGVITGVAIVTMMLAAFGLMTIYFVARPA